MDLFAGPGGLGEGFASLGQHGHFPFQIGMSVEKERSAYQTLTLRSFLRCVLRKEGALPIEYVRFHAGLQREPDWSKVDADAWHLACSEARCLELGNSEAAAEIDRGIERLQRSHQETILIGGPPCQAYSLVGRARSRGNAAYHPAADERHFLFKEYIRVLDRLRPAAFVMENVKGILSSKVDSVRIFEAIMEDLSSIGGAGSSLYELRALTIEDQEIRLRSVRQPSDFIVRAEQFGVPQRRHRVIIIGIRSDLAGRADNASLQLPDTRRATVADAIGDLAPLRSGLSREKDSPSRWAQIISEAADRLRNLHLDDAEMLLAFAQVASDRETLGSYPRESRDLPECYGQSNGSLRRWLENDELIGVAQHSSRSHMTSDLERYLFSSVFGMAKAVSPKAVHYPKELAPKHRNWSSGKFADRFRVQLANEPSTTVTSHISKDGHYFIHPDPAQCRSLTVREAARLQTFPDDYYFLGNRTQQYVQVGNAVPPYLAHQIASLLLQVIDGQTLLVRSGARHLEPVA